MKKQFTILLILIFALGMFFFNFNILPTQAISSPEITSISPNPAYEGDKITILGENFEDCTPGVRTDSKILIGGVEKYFWTGDSKWGNKQITYTTDFGQGSGKLKIINCDKLSSNEVDLAVTKRNPVLISLEPNKVYERFSYSTGPGQYITVYGTDFGNTDPGSMYQFYLNGQHLDRGNISSWTNNSFKLYVPYELGGDDYGRGKVKVIPGDYELQIQLGMINNTWVYSNKISFTVLSSCTQDKWDCSEWGECLAGGKKMRTCTKTFDCPSIEIVSPVTIQSCVYVPPYSPPACSADTWQCGNWGTCSPQGIQTRSCNKTYDCPSVETASPTTSQYCQTSNTTPSNTNNEQAANINRNQILKATVKLICPIDKESGWQGSGTIIDQYGSIITNRHVVDGTIGICRVGFIDNASDIPYFSEIADVKKVSSDQSLNGDMAILKIRNNSNKKFTAVDILLGNSDNLKSGDYILPFGYPKEEEFGEAITFTEGPYSGNGTSVIIGKYKYDVSKFFKTTAVIEHGSSGGGAYQKSTGYYMGIPTLGFEKVNYILSANYIKQWINSFDGNYSVARNNFSSISNLYKETVPIESINLNMLKELDSSKNLLNQTSSESSATESEIVIEEEKNLITKIDNSLSKRVSGNILLQVEKNGEGWYVNPDDKKKYYLGRPADAFSIMRNLGLGIKHSELNGYLNKKFPIRLSGKIMLDVEQNGEAYYVNPNNLKGYYLNRPADAFRIMRELGLGITNNDIRKIDVGEID